MKTAPRPPIEAAQEQPPTISLSRVIAVVPNSTSFGGWGPKVSSSGVIPRLN
ncbi:MAG: hypothetical protein M3R51_08075 [Candidatus Eremiobacteraeota bacterium]|nr:hypothetical protein [Candidatus Eremiobacteraeota bacterium]